MIGGKITKKDIFNKFYNGKKYPIKKEITNNLPKIVRVFGSAAFALIHPPNHFKLPNLILGIWDNNEKSSFGAYHSMIVHMERKGSNGLIFDPVALISTNIKAANFYKTTLAGTYAAKNIQILKKEEYQVQIQGNTLFAGWTKQIPLISSEYILPASCILFEGYGDIKPGKLTNRSPADYKQEVYYNCLEAFVTFFHPTSKYSGPGTEGFIDKEMILTIQSE